MSQTSESIFQQNVIAELEKAGWQRGNGREYDRERALYTADLLHYVKMTQPKEWEKLEALFGEKAEGEFLRAVVRQLEKANPNATTNNDVAKELRRYGTLGVLRNELRIRSLRFKLCQFRPENDLNEILNFNYKSNIFRVVPELVYSPHIGSNKDESPMHSESSNDHNEGSNPSFSAKRNRIDLVLFLNGFPIITMELKSDFKQNIEEAIKQYRETRLAIDPATHRPEPLLTFKRGALVHFAVSQNDLYMTTRLNNRLSDGDLRFLPFNRGKSRTITGDDGNPVTITGAGNNIPEDKNLYPIHYFWDEVLQTDNLLDIIGHYIHLEIKEKEDWEGRKYYEESLIFPRYHQWDVVRQLVNEAREKGAGERYLIQHSAGSGKSNSIAWTAHQLSRLFNEAGERLFQSVIVITDRTILDQQLQETIYQFEHKDGVVVRINDESSAKSAQLADALTRQAPIIIVTIQTFPFVLQHIEKNVALKQHRYAVIADEAHSSQTGLTAQKLRETLMSDGAEGESSEERLNTIMAARRGSDNLSYYAFTATPKDKTLQLFGSPQEDPKPFHIYSMRQAIEEGFILDVLKNYITYETAFQLARKEEERDERVDSKKAQKSINQWVRLHKYNIGQKVKVMVEHFRENVANLLGGQAKAMIVTSSRKEVVLYKKAFDRYVKSQKYGDLSALVAFSGEVNFSEEDPHASELIGHSFTESNMNETRKDLRIAFDEEDYQLMIVANKFQTGFDQPKLCAMYIDRKLGGVDCVQTLSRLNRTYPGKMAEKVYILDFFNEADDIREAFQPYYGTVELNDTFDADMVFDLYDKLRANEIIVWHEVLAYCEAFFEKRTAQEKLNNYTNPAHDRWQHQYNAAFNEHIDKRQLWERAKKLKDPVFIANHENEMKQAAEALDRLTTFKKDLGSYVRFYEFISQVVDYDDHDLERLSLFARALEPRLRLQAEGEEIINLDNLTMSHYRLSRLKEESIKLDDEGGKLTPGSDMGSRSPRDAKEELISQIIQRLNEAFLDAGLSDEDALNFFHNIPNIQAKISSNALVMQQIENNSTEQILHGDFPNAMSDIMMELSQSNRRLMMNYMNRPALKNSINQIVLEMLKAPEVLEGIWQK